jgi:hypothetical protein
MHLSTVDRLVKKLGPVNTLIENLCARLLPNQVALASGSHCECLYEPALCGIKSGYYARFCSSGATGTYEFLDCDC